jgi:hypothetical protein
MVLTLKLKVLTRYDKVYRRFGRTCCIHLVRISQGGEKRHTIQETKDTYPSPEPIIRNIMESHAELLLER